MQAKIERGMVLTNVNRRLGHKAYPYMNKKNVRVQTGQQFSKWRTICEMCGVITRDITIVREHCLHVTFAKEVCQKGNRRTIFL